MKQQIYNQIASLLKANEYDPLLLEIMRNRAKPDFGDYTLNLPLKLAKTLKKPPMEVALELKTIIEAKMPGFFEKIEIAKPGFINLFLSKKTLITNFKTFLKPDFKLDFSYLKTFNIDYEFVSANPTGHLHIGHARNAIIGDVTTRILEMVGHKVYREYYVNDYGNQINDLGMAVRYYYDLLLNNQPQIEEPPYKGPEIQAYAQDFYNQYKDQYKTHNEASFNFIKEGALKHFLADIRILLDRLNLKPFDEFVSERDLYNNKLVEKYLKELQVSGKTYQKDGATWLATNEYGDDKDRVLVKEDGNTTYLVADIVNHVEKLKKGNDKLIDLWGKDHHGYETRVKASLAFLGYDDVLEIDFIDMVQVSDNGNKVKMSKRAGTSLRIVDLLEQMPVDILRFSLLSKSKDQNLEIDISQVKDNNVSNPFYYLQYANARSHQLMNKYNETFTKYEPKATFTFIGDHPKEKELMAKMVEWEEIIIMTLNDREPSILVNYLKTLANAFHSFYNGCPVILEDQTQSRERASLVYAFQNLMAKNFELLGIKPMKKM